MEQNKTFLAAIPYGVKIMSLLLVGCLTLSFSQAQTENFWSTLPSPKDDTYQYNGQTFGIVGTPVHELAINDQGILLLVRNFVGTSGIKHPSFVYRSLDNGTTWQRVDQRFPAGGFLMPGLKLNRGVVQAVAVDSVFLLVVSELSMGHMIPDNNRILRSLDNGKTWEALNTGPVYHETVLFPQGNGKLLKFNGSRFVPERGYRGTHVYDNEWASIETSSDYAATSSELYNGCDTTVLIRDGVRNTVVESINRFSTRHLKTRNAFWANKDSDRWQTTTGTAHNFGGDCSYMFDLETVPQYYNHQDIQFLRMSNIFLEEGGTSMYSRNWKGSLLKSTDGGRNWQEISQGVFRSISRIFPIPCTGNIYVSGYRTNQAQYDPFSRQPQPFIDPIHRSTDGGRTWETLTGLEADVSDWDYGPDGTIYVSTSAGIFKSGEKECVGKVRKDPPPVEFGTTVIVHGMLPEDITSTSWMDRMATAILEKAVIGTIYLYQKDSGTFQKLIQSGNGQEGEHIIIFDWEEEANSIDPGTTESAADALFAALLHGQQQGFFPLKNLHLIGHGRGCIVNTLLTERLINVREKRNISINQVTNLGPFDNGYNAWWEPGDLKINLLDADINDAHPEVNIPYPPASQPNNGVIAWHGIFSDTYWQNSGKVVVDNLLNLLPDTPDQFIFSTISRIGENLEKAFGADALREWQQFLQSNPSAQEKSKKLAALVKKYGPALKSLQALNQIRSIEKRINLILGLKDILYSNLETRPVDGSWNFQWEEFKDKRVIHPTFHKKSTLPTEWLADYIGICDAYIETIRDAELDIHDQKNGGYSLSRLNNFSTGPQVRSKMGSAYPQFGFFQTLKLEDPPVNRIRGILNGSFDRRSEGLLGAEAPGWNYHGGLSTPDVSYPDKMAELNFTGSAVILQHNRLYVPDDAHSLTFKVKTNPLPGHRLTVKITNLDQTRSEVYPISINNPLPDFRDFSVDIKKFQDQVILLSFTYVGDPSFNPAPPSTLYLDEVRFSRSEIQTNLLIPDERQASAVREVQDPPPAKKQYLLEDLSTWSCRGGNLELEREVFALKPSEHKTPVSIEIPDVLVPPNTNYLSFRINNNKLLKGDLTLTVQAAGDPIPQIRFEEKIRVNFFDKMEKDLHNINDDIENLDFDSFTQSFRLIKVDCADLRNQRVSITFQYEPKGSGKPKIFIDKMEFLP